MGRDYVTYKMGCPLSKRVEEVAVYFYINGEIKTGTFNGCDNSYHECEECRECQVKALELFDQDAYVGRKNLERMLAQGFPDLPSIASQDK